MKQIVALFAALLMAVTAFGACSAQRDAFPGKNHGLARKPLDLGSLARQELFDADWQFSQDSAQWRTVNLPHDWSIEGDFDKDAPAGHDGAYLPTGKGWYRKTFTLGKDYQDKTMVSTNRPCSGLVCCLDILSWLLCMEDSRVNQVLY